MAGRDAVHNLSYEMEAGKKYAIVGKSGAGKSTFVKTLLGIIKGTKEIYSLTSQI